MGVLIVLIALTLTIGNVRGDLFTAMADMTNLLGAEKDVTAVIDDYIAAEMRRLEALRKMAEEYSERNAEAMEIGPNYVTNPVNAFLLIKRLTADWQHVESIMRENSADLFLNNITERRAVNEVKYPDQEDLTGAAVALLRLQDTYKLDTHDLANGNILGEHIGQQLTGHDCFEVGRAAYNAKDYYHTLSWMQEAYNRAENELPPTVALSEILEYLAFSLYQQGNVKRALALTKRLVQMDPDHPRAAGNVKWYEGMLEEESKKSPELPPVINKRGKDDIPEREIYEALCRGEKNLPPKHPKKLFCYWKMDRPFLKIAPIKVEIVHTDPLIVVFRNVVSDYEISVVQSLAIPKLKRATVQNAKTGELEHATYRISKSAWLKGEEHPVIRRINDRLHMMTNLNMETAEELQIANYGLGGHYEPHFDFARMSQPERGGATIFSELKQAFWPSVHDAVFWYNLRRNGEGDLRMRHAACPVLTGNKWVSNKWFHERGQEWTRPCGLTPDAFEQFVGDLSTGLP